MNDDTFETHDGATPAAEEREPMALWKKALVALSLLLGGVGVAMGGAKAQPETSLSVASNGTPGTHLNASALGVNSLDGNGEFVSETSGTLLESEAGPMWAPLFAKGGLSFFIAFCIGYALRTFLKGTMLVIGVVALAIFGLQKAQIVGEVDWSKAQGYWDSLTAGLGKQFESFKTFVTGSLPSAASGTVGLFAGFRR